MPFTYEYPRPAVTVDCVIFRLAPGIGHLQVLVIQRDQPPFEGSWALPGGFVGIDEGIDEAARRELQEETGVADVYLEQLYTFGAKGRDPRGRVISVAYYALLSGDVAIASGSDARAARWCDIDSVGDLAFDHAEIIAMARERLRAKVRYAPVIFGLLPKTFALSELLAVYERITGLRPYARHFRRKVDALGVLVPAGERATGRRPATLYRFDPRRAQKRLGDFHL